MLTIEFENVSCVFEQHKIFWSSNTRGRFCLVQETEFNTNDHQGKQGCVCSCAVKKQTFVGSGEQPGICSPFLDNKSVLFASCIDLVTKFLALPEEEPI